MKYTPDGYGERCRFDAFCKTVLRNEARTHLRDLSRQRSRETEFSALPQHEMDKLCTVDEYPSDSILFTAYGRGICGGIILNSAEDLAKAQYSVHT